MSTLTETKISFYKFKKETNHKHVKFTWSDKTGKKIKAFESEKFYCNVYGKDQLSLPKFGMSKNQEWTQIDSKNFKAVSEYGSTVFEVIDHAN